MPAIVALWDAQLDPAVHLGRTYWRIAANHTNKQLKDAPREINSSSRARANATESATLLLLLLAAADIRLRRRQMA
jgi:hypothetical protein